MRNFVLLVFSFSLISFASFAVERVYFASLDGLSITAELYEAKDDAPVILLCHQAGYSRGEFAETALEFNKLGFTCLAIDLRSGNEVNDVINETALRARQSKRKYSYLDAEQDILASLAYLHERYNRQVIVLGSSYSASLALKIASGSDVVSAVIAFSPGEYFGKELTLTNVIKQITVPVFLTGSRNEAGALELISNSIDTEVKEVFIPNAEGFHGSKALWSTHEGSEEYWEALKAFLERII